MGQTHHYGLGEAARSWGGSAAKGGPPHERLHQDRLIVNTSCRVQRQNLTQ
ncbi:MAG: hypothetical protein F6K55_12170 [Moorea sp. SIO4A3]|nr:hypothetical protein [Moorena sp. SIO4A3]